MRRVIRDLLMSQRQVGRQRIDIADAGGGAVSNYALPLSLFYGSEVPATPYQVDADGIEEWFERPAVFYAGTYNRAYIAYFTSDYNIKIKQFDEDTSVLSDAVTLWSDWGWDGNGTAKGDDHSTPSVIVLQYQTGDYAVHNGKLLVAAAEHGSSAATKGRMEVRRSTNAEDITAWDVAVSVQTTLANYANPVEMSDGTIYLFYRYNDNPTAAENGIYFYTSTDAGATWAGPTLLFHNTAPASNYVMVTENSDHTRIHCMFNPAVVDDPSPGSSRYRDIYYAYFDGTNWKKADGTTLTLPLDTTTAGSVPDLVYDTDDTAGLEDWTFLWDIKTDSEGNPYLIFINDPDRADGDAGSSGTGDVYRANYSGAAWVVGAVAKSGSYGVRRYLAGAVPDPVDMDTVYLTPPDGFSTGYSTLKSTQLQQWTRNGESGLH